MGSLPLFGWLPIDYQLLPDPGSLSVRLAAAIAAGLVIGATMAAP